MGETQRKKKRRRSGVSIPEAIYGPVFRDKTWVVLQSWLAKLNKRNVGPLFKTRVGDDYCATIQCPRFPTSKMGRRALVLQRTTWPESCRQGQRKGLGPSRLSLLLSRRRMQCNDAALRQVKTLKTHSSSQGGWPARTYAAGPVTVLDSQCDPLSNVFGGSLVCFDL